MAYTTGTCTGHYELFQIIRAYLTGPTLGANAWTELEYSNAADRLLWLKAPGLSGTKEIILGMRTYQSVPADYYNMSVFGAIGWVNGNSYTTQPGFSGAYGVPLWNNAITYWIIANGQRVFVVAKIQTMFVSFMLGNFFKYSSDGQYPYPCLVMGMLTDESAIRFSDTSYVSGWKGNRANLRIRWVDGLWKTPEVWPQNNGYHTLRNTNADSNVASGAYGLYPIILTDAVNGNYGELDGIYFVSGFDNSAENTTVIGGVTYLIIPDVYRTGAKDFIAIALQ